MRRFFEGEEHMTPMTTEERINAAQKLKPCDVCKLPKEPKTGIAIKDKWHCAKCWVHFFNGRNAK